MKKRLLSAALALAMVLTLIPATIVTAFAADPIAGDDQNPTTSVSVTRQPGNNPSTNQTIGKWYWSDTSTGSTVYHAVISGIVSGTGDSGTWYSADNNEKTGIVNSSGGLKTTSFTLLQDVNLGTLTGIANSGADLTSLTVDVNGYALTLPGNIRKLSSLTVSDRRYGGSGIVNGLSQAVVYGGDDGKSNTDVAAMNLTANNVNVGGIDLRNGRSNRVTLNGATATNITLSGRYKDSSGNYTTTGQTLSTTKANVVSGAIQITGAGSQVTLANVTGGGSSPTGAVTINSTGGKVEVSGQSNIGAMTIKTNAASAVAAAFPSIDIKGGAVAGIDTSTDTNTTSSATVTVSDATVGASGIKVLAGTVNVNAGSNVTGPIEVRTGALNITGSASGTKATGTITLNNNGKTTFKVTGSNVTTGDISAINGSTLTVDIPDDLTNKFGNVTLTGYAGGGIKGGKFKTQATAASGKANYFANTVRFMVTDQVDSGYYAYYGEHKLADAINALGNKAGTATNIVLVGHDATNTITLQNGATTTKKAVIGYSKLGSFYLPNVLLGDTITKWTPQGIPGDGYEPTALYTTPASPNNMILLGQDAGVQLTASKLTSVTVSSEGAYTGGVRANLNGNVITLSGAVTTDAGYTGILLTLATDIRDEDGAYETVPVTVVYNQNLKTLTFDKTGSYTTLAGKGIIVSETSLTMNEGNTVYTLSGSGLGVPAPSLKTAVGSTEIQATVNKSGWTEYQKNALIAKLTSSNSTFNWSTSPAMIQAINAAQLSISSEDTLKNWVTQAQNYVWQYGNAFSGSEASKGKGDGNFKRNTTSTPTEAQRSAFNNVFDTVWLVPYLQATVNDVNEATGYMTLTLVPSFRVVVGGQTEPTLSSNYYIVQVGRSLGELTGDFGNVKLMLNDLPAGFTNVYMHQDDTYVYQQAANKEYTITHAGKTGLGSMVMNSTAPLIELRNKDGVSATPNKNWYDSLQAAVDDTQYKPANKEDLIYISAGYTGSGVINVTGEARTFKITVEGNTTISSNASGDLVKVSGGGHEYEVQLLKDTVSKTANITVNSVTGGSASVSANPAAVGSTVTITLSASTGYTPSGVSVTNASGQSVSVSGSGSSYTFTMPSGKVTVTPSFTQVNTTTNAAVTVTSPSAGTGTATTNAGGNRVAPGTIVTVTTAPSMGQRTMDVSVSGATAVRTGVNQFQFVVPSGYSNVTVTPVFDQDNGTSFSDVWTTGATAYCSNAVAWAVNKGITTGTSTYTFSPSNSCYRQDMVTFLYRAAGSPAVGNVTNPFWDVQPGSYYYNAVMWAVQKGITNGVSANQFGVNQTVSRAQAVTFLYRAAGSPSASSNNAFGDAGSSAYYAKAVTWAANKGITNGDGGTTTFNPSGNCLRGQIVTFMYRDSTGKMI